MSNKTNRRGNFTNYEVFKKPLYDDFVMDLACKKLKMTKEEIEAITGLYTSKSKNHAGKSKGYLRWYKVSVGGWIHGCGVVPPCSFGYILCDYHGLDYTTGKYIDDDKWLPALYSRYKSEKINENWQRVLSENEVTLINSDRVIFECRYLSPCRENIDKLIAKDNELELEKRKNHPNSKMFDEILWKYYDYCQKLSKEQLLAFNEAIREFSATNLLEKTLEDLQALDDNLRMIFNVIE